MHSDPTAKLSHANDKVVGQWNVVQDWSANGGNTKGRVVMLLFRIAHLLRRGPVWLRPLALLYGPFYRVGVEWLMGIELPWKTVVGEGLRLDHGVGLVINDHAIIGRNCHLRQSTTIGHKQRKDGSFSGAPVLEDHVNVGANVVIIGEIRVGSGAAIGAGSVVVKDVPPHSTVAGNPAKVISLSPSSREEGYC